MSGTTFSKLPVMIVALVIGLILTFTAVMPLVSDYSDDKTFTNTGTGQYKYISSEEEYSLNWYYSTPTKVTVNGVEIDGIPGNESLAMGDFTVRIQPTSSGYAQLILSDNESGITANASESKNFSFIYSDGVITVSNGTTSKTIDSDGFYAIVPEKGTHTMKSTTTTAYINSNDELLVMGITNVGAQWNTGYLVEGTIKDYTVEQWTGVTSYTPTNITDDSVKVSGYNDLYTIKQFQWTIDNNGTPQTVTYNYFLVPLEVTGSPDNPAAYKNLVSVLPLFALILLVAGAASLVYFKNKD